MTTNTSLKKLHHPKTSFPVVQQANTDGKINENTIAGKEEDWNVEDTGEEEGMDEESWEYYFDLFKKF